MWTIKMWTENKRFIILIIVYVNLNVGMYCVCMHRNLHRKNWEPKRQAISPQYGCLLPHSQYRVLGTEENKCIQMSELLFKKGKKNGGLQKSLLHSSSAIWSGTCRPFLKTQPYCLEVILHSSFFYTRSSWFQPLSHSNFSLKNKGPCDWVVFSVCFWSKVFTGSKGIFSFWLCLFSFSTSWYNSFKIFVGFLWFSLQTTPLEKGMTTDTFSINTSLPWTLHGTTMG